MGQRGRGRRPMSQQEDIGPPRSRRRWSGTPPPAHEAAAEPPASDPLREVDHRHWITVISVVRWLALPQAIDAADQSHSGRLLVVEATVRLGEVGQHRARRTAELVDLPLDLGPGEDPALRTARFVRDRRVTIASLSPPYSPVLGKVPENCARGPKRKSSAVPTPIPTRARPPRTPWQLLAGDAPGDSGAQRQELDAARRDPLGAGATLLTDTRGRVVSRSKAVTSGFVGSFLLPEPSASQGQLSPAHRRSLASCSASASASGTSPARPW